MLEPLGLTGLNMVSALDAILGSFEVSAGWHPTVYLGLARKQGISRQTGLLLSQAIWSLVILLVLYR